MGWLLDDARFKTSGPPERVKLSVAERLARRDRFMRGGASGAQRVLLAERATAMAPLFDIDALRHGDVDGADSPATLHSTQGEPSPARSG